MSKRFFGIWGDGPVEAGALPREIEGEKGRVWHQSTDHLSAWAGSDPNGLFGEHAGVVVWLQGHPRWDDGGAKGAMTVAALAEQYQRQGAGCLKQLAGRFSIAIADPGKGSLLVAVDKLGILPLAYSCVDGQVIFGNDVGLCNRHPRFRSDLNPQAVYDYLFFHTVPAPLCIFKGFTRLLPGHYVEICNGIATTERYWNPQFETRGDKATLMRDVKQQLEVSLAHQLESGVKVGAFLSGGIDSSTVTGLLAKHLGPATPAFSIGFKADGYDEMEYARLAARHFGITHHEYYVTPSDVLEAIPKIAAAYDEPFGNSSAVPAYYCAAMAAEHGVDRLLAGDGGDELFAGNERYAKQKVFAWYDHVPSFLRRGILNPLLNGRVGDALPWPLSKAASYVRQATLPMPDRMATYNHVYRDGEQIFVPEFLDGVVQDHPLDVMREAYHGANAPDMLSSMLALDWKITLSDNDLRKVNGMCELAGVDVAYPLLDDGMVALSARVPSAVKLPGLNLRGFFKESVTGFLPDEILNKSKHGFGLPFGVWMRTDKGLKNLAVDAIEGFASREIVRPEYLRELLRKHEDEHAAFYGEFVWVIVMLELWLRSQTR